MTLTSTSWLLKKASLIFPLLALAIALALSGCTAENSEKAPNLAPAARLTLQVETGEILAELAGSSRDSLFDRVLTQAVSANLDALGQLPEHFLAALQAEYSRIGRPEKDAQLITYFLSYENELPTLASNSKVLKYLDRQIQNGVSSSFTILRKRIDGLGVAQPYIEMDEKSARIMIELQGEHDLERIAQMVGQAGDLGFWETYTTEEASPIIDRMENTIDKTLPQVDIKVKYVDSTAVSETEESIMEETFDDAAPESENEPTMEEFQAMHPFLGLFNQGYPMSPDRPLIGMASPADTAEINGLMQKSEVIVAMGPDVKFLWEMNTTLVADENGAEKPHIGLICIKKSKRNKPRMSGEVIIKAQQDFDQYANMPIVTVEMNSGGADDWRRMTRDNVGKSIAIVLDDRVCSYPNVQGAITGGRSQITGQFTIEEARDLATILQSGALPAKVSIIEKETLKP